MPLDFEPFSENNIKVPTKHIISVEDITINKELGMGQFGVVQQGTWATGNQRVSTFTLLNILININSPQCGSLTQKAFVTMYTLDIVSLKAVGQYILKTLHVDGGVLMAFD